MHFVHPTEKNVVVKKNLHCQRQNSKHFICWSEIRLEKLSLKHYLQQKYILENGQKILSVALMIKDVKRTLQ